MSGGAEGNRTPDLLNAIQALSQLSYGPIARERAYNRRPHAAQERPACGHGGPACGEPIEGKQSFFEKKDQKTLFPALFQISAPFLQYRAVKTACLPCLLPPVQ